MAEDRKLPDPILPVVEGADLMDSPRRTSRSQDETVEFLSWESPSRIYDSKSPKWFLGVFFIGLVVIVLLAILRELFLSLFVAATIFVLYALARVEPALLPHAIQSNGIVTNGRLFEWKDLNSFWVYRSKETVVLRLDTKLYLPHIVELLLPEETPEDDVEELKELLMEYLPMKERPHSEVGTMADGAILSVASKLPGQGRMAKWLSTNLGIK